MSGAQLNVIVKDLKDMKYELLPNDPAGREHELENMDTFQRNKYLLNVLLRDIRAAMTKWRELTQQAPDGRDLATIRSASELNKQLKQASDMWKVIRDEVVRHTEWQDRENRQRIATLLGREIQEMMEQMSSSSSSSTPKPVVSPAAELLASRRAERQQKRDQRRRPQQQGQNDLELDKNDRPMQLTDQEQAFMEEVEQKRREEDDALEAVNQGMDELKQLALDMNQQITTSGALVHDLNQKADHVVATFKTSNTRLKDILVESGGLSRWCPMILCLVFLLALVGYIYNMQHK